MKWLGFQMLFRFGLSGIGAAIAYYGTARFLLVVWDWSAFAAGLTAYLLSMPIAYLLHRQFTFRSGARVGPEVRRFILSSAIGVVLASFLPLFFRSRGLNVDASLVATCILVPAISYVLLSGWVFVRGSRHG